MEGTSHWERAPTGRHRGQYHHLLAADAVNNAQAVNDDDLSAAVEACSTVLFIGNYANNRQKSPDSIRTGCDFAYGAGFSATAYYEDIPDH